MRVGRFIQSAAIMVMRENDLVEFGRQMYARSNSIAGWSDADLLAQGLTEAESAILEKIPCREGQLLVLGVGGGREAIPLARLGFTVTGLDFVPEMVETARQNAARQGLVIRGLVQEISHLHLETELFDVIWLWAAMYSCIPTRRRRMVLLARIREALRPGGYFVCQFSWAGKEQHSRKGEFVRRTLACLTLGNFFYEPGDTLRADIEFLHNFSSEEEIRSEFVGSGLELVYFNVRDGWVRGEALLKKPGP